MSRSSYARIALVVVLLLVGYWVFRILQPFLSALVWAVILATVFYPSYERLCRWLRRPALASILTCLLITALIVLPVILLLVLLAGESVQAYRGLEVKMQAQQLGRLETLRQTAAYQWLLGKMQAMAVPEPNFRQLGVEAIRQLSQFLVGHGAALFSRFGQFVMSFFVMVLSLYYFFVNGPGILQELSRLSLLRREYEEVILTKFKQVAVATFGGSLLTAVLQGVAGGLVFLVFGLSSPLLWGAVMALLSLVPVVGTALVWGPVVVYYLLTGSLAKGLGLAVVCGAVVGSIDNLVKPLLIRRGSEIHTLWLFFGVMGGIGAFGFLGLILGPLLIAVLFALMEIYKIEFRGELGAKQAP
jgi:predicted PurR-regulated permease PerM